MIQSICPSSPAEEAGHGPEQQVQVGAVDGVVTVAAPCVHHTVILLQLCLGARKGMQRGRGDSHTTLELGVPCSTS